MAFSPSLTLRAEHHQLHPHGLQHGFAVHGDQGFVLRQQHAQPGRQLLHWVLHPYPLVPKALSSRATATLPYPAPGVI